MATVQQLYELWAGDSELRDELRQSLAPRGSEWLFDSFALWGVYQLLGKLRPTVFVWRRDA